MKDIFNQKQREAEAAELADKVTADKRNQLVAEYRNRVMSTQEYQLIDKLASSDELNDLLYFIWDRFAYGSEKKALIGKKKVPKPKFTIHRADVWNFSSSNLEVKLSTDISPSEAPGIDPFCIILGLYCLDPAKPRISFRVPVRYTGAGSGVSERVFDSLDDLKDWIASVAVHSRLDSGGRFQVAVPFQNDMDQH